MGGFLTDPDSTAIENALLVAGGYEENPVGVEHDKMGLFFSRFFYDNMIIFFPAIIIIKMVAGCLFLQN